MTKKEKQTMLDILKSKIYIATAEPDVTRKLAILDTVRTFAYYFDLMSEYNSLLEESEKLDKIDVFNFYATSHNYTNN